MSDDDSSLFPKLAWNRFNSVFPVPESDDAARVANEVKASIDTWIANSLDQLEKDMNGKAQLAVERLNLQIEASRNALSIIQSEFSKIRDAASALSPTDQNLAAKIADLQQKSEAARTAVADAAKQWENYGKNAVQTFKQIASTVATMAG